MWPSNTIQRNICVVFVTCVVIISILKYHKVRKEYHINNNNNTVDVSKLKSSKKSVQIPSATKHNFIDLPTNISTKFDQATNKRILYVLGLFELTTKWGERQQGQSEIAAAQLAIKHINNLNVLPGYKIQLLTNDTKCDPGVGIDRLFHAIYSNKTIIMLLGTSCSNVTESLAHIVPYWNILQISFGSTSPSLSDRKKFPLFFRTVAPESSHNLAKIEFVKAFNWNVVATFCQSENDYLLPLNNLITQFENANISCAITITFSLDNYKEQLKILKDSDVRIIIGSFSAQLATKIFCEAHNLGMYGSDYVWILQDRHEFWWQSLPDNCGRTDLNRAIDGVILVSDYNMNTANDTTISGLEFGGFERELYRTGNKISKYASQTYDAIWTIALTLRQTFYPYSIHQHTDFSYRNRDIVDEFIRQMSSLSFIGLSGPVKFIGADRIGNSLLRQIQNGRIVKVGIYDPLRNRLSFQCTFCQRIVWRNNQTPIAKRILKTTLITIPTIIFYLTLFISIIGVCISLLFLYFNLHFRRVRTVKITSPNLNNVAVFGCIFVYIYVVLLGFDMYTLGPNRYFMEFCTIRVYLLSSGLSLAFGSMFAKTYRIHRIFVDYGSKTIMKDKLLKDNLLIVIILIPLIIDGIILRLWIMIDPMERKLYNLTLQMNPDTPDIVYQPQVEMCASQNTSGWYIAIYGYKGIILIIGLFMAWETRHIKVPALNDSQYIGICVYSAVFSAIITILCSLTSEYILFTYLARTITILMSTSLILFLLFLPKLKSVVIGRIDCHDPIMESMGLRIEHKTCRFIIDETKEQLNRLEIQNRVYKCQLVGLNLEIERLEQLLALSNENLNCPSIDKECSSSDEYLRWPIVQKIKRKYYSTNELMNTMKSPIHQIVDDFKRIFNVNSKRSSKIANITRQSLPIIQCELQENPILIKAKSDSLLSTTIQE